MALLPLVIAPDPRLKTPSSPVPAVNDEIRTLAANMFDTMYHERGVGLAAVQVGIMLRLIVADVEWRENPGSGAQHVFINPEILEDTDEMSVYKEGCLSFPDQYADVERPAQVRVRFTDLTGQVREQTFTGLLATCVQHEIDHINGITFVDHISRLKREMILKRLTKMKKQGYFEPGHDHGHVHGEHCNHG
jgi:peptide deformylase